MFFYFFILKRIVEDIYIFNLILLSVGVLYVLRGLVYCMDEFENYSLIINFLLLDFESL